MNDRIDHEQAEAVSQASSPMRRRLGFLMRDSARLMRRRFVQLARETALPINHSEATTLLHIADEPGLHQAVLALRLDVEPIAMVRLLDGLQRAGLIERRSHEHDRRIRTIWLTEAAHSVLERIDTIRMKVRDEALAGFPSGEGERLLNALEAMRRNLGGQALCGDPHAPPGE